MRSEPFVFWAIFRLLVGKNEEKWERRKRSGSFSLPAGDEEFEEVEIDLTGELPPVPVMGARVLFPLLPGPLLISPPEGCVRGDVSPLAEPALLLLLPLPLLPPRVPLPLPLLPLSMDDGALESPPPVPPVPPARPVAGGDTVGREVGVPSTPTTPSPVWSFARLGFTSPPSLISSLSELNDSCVCGCGADCGCGWGVGVLKVGRAAASRSTFSASSSDPSSLSLSLSSRSELLNSRLVA